jgi:hypothetical protein
MSTSAIALALAAAAPQAPAAVAPLPEAQYVVLTPTNRDGSPSHLDEQTHRLLATMHDIGLLAYRRSALKHEGLSECLDEDIEPSPERTACVRRLAGPAQGGLPVVAMVIGYARERGAWQRLECIGPNHRGFARQVYVDQAFHQRSEWRAGIRGLVLDCVRDALGVGGVETNEGQRAGG